MEYIKYSNRRRFSHSPHRASKLVTDNPLNKTYCKLNNRFEIEWIKDDVPLCVFSHSLSLFLSVSPSPSLAVYASFEPIRSLSIYPTI